MDHIKFNREKDIGFYSNGMKMEATSRFAFLTYDKKAKTIINNYLICDPYYDDIQIALFKSSKTFSSKSFFGKKNKDVIIRNIMYRNQEGELKIVSQYPSDISIHAMKDENLEEDDESG